MHDCRVSPDTLDIIGNHLVQYHQKIGDGLLNREVCLFAAAQGDLAENKAGAPIPDADI